MMELLNKVDIKPCIYMYPIFLSIIYVLFKEQYFKNMVKETIEVIKRNKVLLMLSLTIFVIILFAMDKNIALVCNKINDDPLEIIKVFSKLGNIAGNGNFIYSILAMCAIAAIFLKKNEKIFMISLASSVYAGLFVTVAKGIISRARPPVAFNNFDFFAYAEAIDRGKLFKFLFTSMPSGHTITIVAAIVPFVLYTKNKYIKILLIGVAAVTAFNRIFSTAHWTSDVFVGAVIGTIIGTAIYNNNKTKLEGGL